MMTVQTGTPKGKQKPFRGVPKGKVSSYIRRGLSDPNEVEYFMPMQYGSEAEEREYFNPSWKSEPKPLISRELPASQTSTVKTTTQSPTVEERKSPQVKLTREQISAYENRDNIRSLSRKYHVPVQQVIEDIEKSPTAYFGVLTTGAPTYKYPPEVGESNYEHSLAETRAKIQGRMTGIMSWEKVESVRPMSGSEEWLRGDTKKFIMEQPRTFREGVMPSYENTTKELDMLRNLGLENVTVEVENPEYTKLSYMGRRSDILAGSVSKIPIVSLVTDPIGDYIGYSDTIKAVGKVKEEGYKPVYPVTLLGQKVGDLDVGFISNPLTNPKSFESLYGELYGALGGQKSKTVNMSLGEYEGYLGGKIREEASFHKKMGEEELVATVGTSLLYAPFTAPTLVKLGSETAGWIGAGVGGKVAGEQTYEWTGSKELSLGASLAGSFLGARQAVKAYEGSPRVVFQRKGFVEWEGLAIEQGVFSKPIIGRDTSTGLITLGTPKNIKINAPLTSSARTAWAETATEAKIAKRQLMPDVADMQWVKDSVTGKSNRELVVGRDEVVMNSRPVIWSGKDAQMVEAGNSFTVIHAPQKGRIYRNLPLETKTMTIKESQIFLNFAKKEKILLGGSAVMDTGMPRALEYVRKWMTPSEYAKYLGEERRISHKSTDLSQMGALGIHMSPKNMEKVGYVSPPSGGLIAVDPKASLEAGHPLEVTYRHELVHHFLEKNPITSKIQELGNKYLPYESRPHEILAYALESKPIKFLGKEPVKDAYYQNRPLEKGAGDWDGLFPYPTAKAEKTILDLFNPLDAVSPQKFKVTGIGIRNEEAGAHAFDGHANDVVKSWSGDTSFTPEMRSGFVLPQKPTKISGIPVRNMNELRTRKTTSMFGFYKTETGALYVHPENVRMKDAPDAINLMRGTQMEAETGLGLGRVRAVFAKKKLDFVVEEGKRRGWYTPKDVGQPIGDIAVDITKVEGNKKIYFGIDSSRKQGKYLNKHGEKIPSMGGVRNEPAYDGGRMYPKSGIVGGYNPSGYSSRQSYSMGSPKLSLPRYSQASYKVGLRGSSSPNYLGKSLGGTMPSLRSKTPQVPRSPSTKYSTKGGFRSYPMTSPKPRMSSLYKPHGYSSTPPKLSYGMNPNRRPKAVPFLNTKGSDRKLFKSLPLFGKLKKKEKSRQIDFDDYVQVMTGRKRKAKREFIDFRLFNTRPKKGRRMI